MSERDGATVDVAALRLINYTRAKYDLRPVISLDDVSDQDRENFRSMARIVLNMGAELNAAMEPLR